MNIHSLDITRPVQVYRNLNKKGVVYSVRQGGKVIGYTTNIKLHPCKFHVSEKARLRVVANKCREVHAWIEGYIVESEIKTNNKTLSYNPYKFAHFYDVQTKQAVIQAALIHFKEQVFYE